MLKRGPVYVLICYICWGLLPVFWKTLAVVDSLYVLAMRVIWSMVIAALIVKMQKKEGALREAWTNRKERLRLMLAGLFISVNWGLYIWAVSHDHILDTSLAYYMNPILSILLGTVVFREKLTKIQWMSVLVTFVGIVITVIRYHRIPWVALIIAATFAIYGAIKKGVRAEAGVSVFYETLTVTPVALAFVVWAESRSAGAIGVLHGWQWLLLPMAGLVTSVPLLFYSRGIKETPMSLSGILMYVNPTLQLLLSVLLYQEEFTTTHAILFGFVWSGLILYLVSGFLQESGRKKKEAASCE